MLSRKAAVRLFGSAMMLCGAASVPLPVGAHTIFDQSNTIPGAASVSACSGIGYSASATPGTAWVPGINGADGATVCDYDTGLNSPTSTPEPGMSALMGTGMTVGSLRLRRRSS